MTTVLLTWNPKKYNWVALPAAVVTANQTGHYDDRWSCGVRTKIGPGDRFFLMRLGIEPKGILGSGFIASRPDSGQHWEKPAENAKYVDIYFDVLSEEPLIPLKRLLEPPFSSFNFTPQPSGNSITPNVAAALEKAWANATNRVPSIKGKSVEKFTEGKRRQVQSYMYERDDVARRKCIEHFGYKCYACGFDFEQQYGKLGHEYIQVHHKKPLSEIRKEYEVNPKKDLVPLCANCHVMIHRKVPALTVEELRKQLRHIA